MLTFKSLLYMRNTLQYIALLQLLFVVGCANSHDMPATPVDPQPPGLSFDIDISNIYHDRIEGTVTPSDNDDTYICTHFFAEDYNIEVDRYGDDTEGFIERMFVVLDRWEILMSSKHRGPISLDGVCNLQPETDYVVVCCDYYSDTTRTIYAVPFRTIAASDTSAE